MAMLAESDTPYLVPISEAAALADLPKRTVYQWVAEQRLTCTDESPRRVDFHELVELMELRSSAGWLPGLRRPA